VSELLATSKLLPKDNVARHNITYRPGITEAFTMDQSAIISTNNKQRHIACEERDTTTTRKARTNSKAKHAAEPHTNNRNTQTRQTRTTRQNAIIGTINFRVLLLPCLLSCRTANGNETFAFATPGHDLWICCGSPNLRMSSSSLL
jgi:hypothetical protein